MPHSILRSIAAAVVLAAASTVAQAASISGVTATSSVGTFATYDIDNLTNGVGLSEPGSTSATHDSLFPGMWLSNTGNTVGSLVFDLGGIFSLSSLDIWNYNAVCCGLNRGVQRFDLEISSDGISYSALLGASLLTQSAGGDTLASEQFDLGGASGQFVRLNILSNYGSGSYVGLSEVLFSSQMAAVPIPATLPLLALGLGGLGFAARRRRKAA